MLLRRVRTTLAAARYFSAVAAVAAKPATTGGATIAATNSDGRDTLGRRLLSLVYAKRSAVIAIRKWKEEGHVVRKLLKLMSFTACLIVYGAEIVKPDDIKLQPGDYAVHLGLIAKVRGLSSAEKFFEDLPNGLKGQPTCTSLLHTYVQHKESSKAEALMEKMSECGFLKYPLPYNHMLSLYISQGQLDKVPAVIQELKKNTSPDVVTYNLWLTSCASQNDVEAAEKIFLELKKAKIDPDWVTYSTLSSLYIRKLLFDKAKPTLKEMEKRTFRKLRVAYSSLLSLHTNIESKDEVNRIWKKMKSTFLKMNDAEYNCMISSLLKLNEFEEAEKIYTKWESVSGSADSRVSNLLLAFYINKKEMELAENFYNRMVQRGIKPSYTTWELLTWGYLKQKQTDKVLDCFKRAVGSVKKWEPDEKIIREVFRNLEEQGNVDGAEQLLVTLQKAGHLNTEVYNLLLRTCVKAEEQQGLELGVAEMEGEGRSEMEFTEIETRAECFDSSVIFHVVADILGILQDVNLEFDTLQTEYKELEMVLAQNEFKASFRRKHAGRMREVKQGIRRLEKIPDINGVILVLGASPIRPRHVYEVCFLHGKVVSRGDAIRTLISKGAGSDSYVGPTKLFLLVKAPPSFNLPLHFLSKRDFRYSKKIVPLRLQFKCITQDLETDGQHCVAQTAESVSLLDSTSNDLICKVGHRKEYCNLKLTQLLSPTPALAHQRGVSNSSVVLSEQILTAPLPCPTDEQHLGNEAQFGPWMLVNRRNCKPLLLSETPGP
ncbi:Pentatricopeptide repeat-containing protein [Camellia lanceoleosa]|uniref:Pentatricopeptide repeat-containing protein n=1 Tax=Camellia lanceoleosa TaxID=1840588 RepID=A0ACC0F3T1_9ERIC|nr:Pentatricopeptide repeat-containing protein [Camellia lanceoleosa]